MDDLIARSGDDACALASKRAKRHEEVAVLAASLGWQEEPLAA
jgi:hypothetical protein